MELSKYSLPEFIDQNAFAQIHEGQGRIAEKFFSQGGGHISISLLPGSGGPLVRSVVNVGDLMLPKAIEAVEEVLGQLKARVKG